MTENETNLIGQTVEVKENPETISFVGHVTKVSENKIDGVLVSVLDQEDNVWDIESKYISIYK
ncbi:MAG: Unknown protein [uncultured Sulfurovum sp.]|uniref:DUF2187 domain-containing protein n=1 Tax=uncultured Sulfurovum sp. TaxID=269237 RepID=A0A6S6SWS6_9BACT|nr:MAG: Unknown protein [uncultured Sulfurovum sp.]